MSSPMQMEPPLDGYRRRDRRLWRVCVCFRAMAATTVLVACGGQPQSRGVSVADAGDSGPDALNSPDSTIAANPGLRGVLVDESGAPIEGAQVLACMATTCLFSRSGPGGGFTFAIAPPAAVALKTPEDLTAQPRRGALLVPVRISDQAVDVGEVHVPSLSTGTALAADSVEARDYEAGDGLMLRLSARDLTPRLGDTLGDVAARRIPISWLRSLPMLAHGEIVAVYALHPFAAASTSPIAARAPSTLRAGTQVRFWTISEIDGRLSEPVPGRSDGSFIETEAGLGLTELTWLVVSL